MNRERVLNFGPGGALVGILCEPSQSSATLPAVLFWNVGINHRVGPYRFNVDLSRALAEDGFSSLRFDLGGLGDSAPVNRPGVVDAAHGSDDVRAAIDVLRKRGFGSFIVVGFCSGVDQAHAVALSEPDVTGAVFIEGYAYPTAGWYLRYPLRFFEGRRWKRLFTDRRTTWLGAAPPPRETVYVREYPPQAQFQAEARRMADRGTRVLFFAAGTTQIDNALQMEQNVGGPHPRIVFAHHRSADHTFYRSADRRRAIDEVRSFIKAFAGDSARG